MAVLTPRSVYRYYETDGVPSSGKHEPIKAEIIQLLEQIFGVSRGGWVVTQTLAELNGVVPENETDGGVVLADPDPANNGYYQRDGVVWVRGRGFPDTFARVALSGSGSTQTGVVEAGVNPADAEVFFAFVEAENDGALTLAIGGEAPREVLNLAGQALSAGEWAGAVMFALRDGKYQLLLDAGAAHAAAQSASDAKDQKDYAEEWAQSDDPISVSAGGDGSTDRSSKWHAYRSETAQEASEDARDLARSYRDTALAAKDASVAASEAAGVDHWVDTYADAEAALSGYAEGDVVGVFTDETKGGATVWYRVESGVLVEKLLAIDGAIKASRSGLVSSAVMDQFTRLNAIVQFASQRRLAIDLEGMEIRVGKQTTSDSTYKYVRDPAEVDDGTLVKRTYAIKLPEGGYMKLTGGGTIGNLNSDDNQYIFHSVNADYVEIGDGVTLDGYHAKQGWGGTLHMMGLNQLHLGRCSFVNDDIVRIGASTTRRSGRITFTEPKWTDCFGTHCIGGKPGGFTSIYGNTLSFERCSGGLNCETEDEDGFNDDGEGGTLWDTKIVGGISTIYADDLDGDKTPASPSPAYALVVTDSEFAAVHVGSIIARNIKSSLSNAACVLVGGGQLNLPPSSVVVDYIHAISVGQVLRYAPTDAGGERIVIGTVTGNGVKQVIKAIPENTVTGAPVGAREISINNLHLNTVSGEALYIENDSAYAGDIIQKLTLGDWRVEEVGNCAGYIDSVGELIIGKYSWGDVTTFKSAQPYVNYAFWATVGRLTVSGFLRSGGSHNRAFRFEPTTSAELNGLEVSATDTGAAITLSGSGEVTLRDGAVVSSAGAGLASDSFTGEVDLLNFDLNGTSIQSATSPRKVRDSDFLKTTVSAWAPGAITAGTPATTTFSMPSIEPGDVFRVAPTTNIGTADDKLVAKARFSAANTGLISLNNLDAGGTVDPGTADWFVVGERG